MLSLNRDKTSFVFQSGKEEFEREGQNQEKTLDKLITDLKRGEERVRRNGSLKRELTQYQIFISIGVCLDGQLSSLERGAAIAQWIGLRLPSCCPGFKYQAHNLRFFQFIFELGQMEKTKINKKRPGLAHFFKKMRV